MNSELLHEWCRTTLGSAPVATVFATGHLSDVRGVCLANGDRVVLKVRPWQDRLLACAQVQWALHAAGYPAPELLAGPDVVDGCAVSAETLMSGGPLAATEDAATLFATALIELVAAAPPVDSVGPLAPSPAWADWRGDDRSALWPAPDDRDTDLNAMPHSWVDEVATIARDALHAIGGAPVIGHVDWYSLNLAWRDRELLAVYDWDSVDAQPEPAIAGLAAANWPATVSPGEVASLQQSQAFLAAYEQARDVRWSAQDVTAAWAAGLWVRCFDAKKAASVGDNPDAILTRAEALQRLEEAGLAAG